MQCLNELLEDDDKFGFIVMDGNGTLYGTLCGNTRNVLHKFGVDLPKKHGRGGQSALRFSRLREEKRHNYVRKVAELATQYFITADKPNVTGLVLAGSADFKTVLGNSGGQISTTFLRQPRGLVVTRLLRLRCRHARPPSARYCHQERRCVVWRRERLQPSHCPVCGVTVERKVYPGARVDQPLLRGNQPGHWQVLLRCEGHHDGAP